MDSVTVVGASLAGHASARALRGEGFDGRITIVGDESHRPYDRPPLSKDFLAGRSTIDDIALEAEGEDLAAEWRLGSRAIALDPRNHLVTLADGAIVQSDAVVIATGSTARRFPGAVRGVHTLRTLDDALALRPELQPGIRLVIVGSGFIGLEVASTASELGVDVVVLGASESPLELTFGPTVGAMVQRLHEARGVTVRNSTRVAGVVGTDRITGVRLATGEVIAADVVLLGIGSLPAVGWLGGSGLEVTGRDGVSCNSVGASSAPGVIAVGDCAAWFDPVRGGPHRVEHWFDSRDRPAVAIAALLSGGTTPRALRPSYVWSDQAGVRLQFAGRLVGGEEVTIEAGGVETDDLLMVYRRDNEPVAVVGINQQKLVATWRKRLAILEASVSSVQPEPQPQPQTQRVGA